MLLFLDNRIFLFLETPDYKRFYANLAPPPYPGVHKVFIYGLPFLGHYNSISNLTDLSLSVEKGILMKPSIVTIKLIGIRPRSTSIPTL